MTEGRFLVCPPRKEALRFRIKRLAMRYSVGRFIALWLAPHIEKGRRCYLRARVIKLRDSIGAREVTLGQKISAAGEFARDCGAEVAPFGFNSW